MHSTPIVNILAREFQDTNQLAKNLQVLSGPLYQQRQGGQIVQERNSMFMRLDAKENNKFFINLENAVKGQLSNPNDSINAFNNAENWVTTSDPYKFSFLQFHHAISSKDFVLLGDMERLFHVTMAQPNQVVSPSTHYVLHAEKTAYQYAMRRTQLQRVNYKNFEPEIVALLENPERVKLFFLAYAQGLLTFTDGAGAANTVWALHGDGVMDSVTIFDKVLDNINAARNPTVYEILHLWLIGKDANPQHADVITIEWDKLNKHILEQERGPMQETILASYQKHMDENDPDSLVKLIRRQAIIRSNAIANINQRFYQNDMFEDLIDLVKIFYIDRLEIYENAQRRAGNQQWS